MPNEVRNNFLEYTEDYEDLSFLNILSENIRNQIDEIKNKQGILLDNEENKINNLENELKEIKNLGYIFGIFKDFIEKSYIWSLKRFQSLFIEDRKIAEKTDLGILDLPIFLDCSWKWICMDHHFINTPEVEVATSIVIDFIKENPRYASILLRLFELANAPQILANYKKYLKNKKAWEFKKFLDYFISFTKWYLDTDAILAHFALSHPKKAIRYEKILTQAAMRWDLNLEVSSKAKTLNDIIAWIYIMFYWLKKQYMNYLNLKYAKNTELIEKSLVVFDTMIWNAIVKMVPKMLNFINEKNFNGKSEEEYYRFFSRAQNIYSWIVDEKTEDIYRYNENYNKSISINSREKEKIKALEKDWLMKIETNWKVISFVFNKNITVDFRWVPSSSFFKYIRTNENIDSSNLKYNIISTIKCMDEESPEKAKYISISNIANNVWDLKKYSLKNKLAELNELELSNLQKLLQKKLEELEKHKLQNWKKTKWKIKWLEQEIHKLEEKINFWKRNWVYNYRNWLIFCSSVYSSLSDIINILNKD